MTGCFTEEAGFGEAEAVGEEGELEILCGCEVVELGHDF